MLEEEAQHLPRGVRPSRIGVGASGAASRPCVSGSMDVPVLKHCSPGGVGMDGAGMGMSSRYATVMYLLLGVRGSPRPRHDMVAVAGMHCGVPIAMKNDGGDNQPVSRNRRNVAEP